MQKITIGEIAERVRDVDEELLAVRGRLRFWVAEGIIKPEGNPKAPGRHRHFGERAIIIAGILSHLAHRYGISWTPRDPSPRSKMFLVALEEAKKLRSPADENQKAFLVLWSEGGVEKRASVNCAVRYVDLKSKSRQFVEIPLEANDAIVIDLTRLFGRIGVPLVESELINHHEKEVERLRKKFPSYGRIKRG
jgi:hypothetical protein